MKAKITNHQILCLTAGTVIGGAILVIASIIAGIAKQDAWITGIVTLILGFPVIWVIVFLGRKFPNKTLLEMIQTLLGKWIGTAISVSFIFLCFQLSYHIPWYISNFITSQVMPETPSFVVNALFITAMSVALLYGLEAIARAAELFLYISSAMFIFAMVMVIPKARIENLQPVLENGLLPVLKGSVFLSCFTVLPAIFLLMIFPMHAMDPEKGNNAFYKGYLFGASISFISILLSILVLGWGITANSRYPAYRLAKEIQVGVLFSRIEFAIFASWLLTQFIIASVFFYTCITGLGQILKLDNPKKIVLPLSLIFLTMSEVVFPDVMYQENWIITVWAPYIITYGLVLPFFLFSVYWLKKWLKKN